MGVTATEYDNGNLVEVACEASGPPEALYLIDQWALQKGLIRWPGVWLRHFLIEGKNVYKAVCFRPSSEEKSAVESEIVKMRQLREKLSMKMEQIESEEIKTAAKQPHPYRS